ncbi:MAG: lichenicidin A2 family type 2 lantibiotic [Staphylococcus aureus]
MAKVNIENVIKHIDFQKIKEEKKNGKSLEEILKGIDLKPIIREEMVKINPDVQDEEIESVVKEIDLIKVLGSILENENVSKEIAGKFFEDLSEEEMLMLQGAGDVDVEVTPTITTSSTPCIGAVSAVTGGILSWAKC